VPLDTTIFLFDSCDDGSKDASALVSVQQFQRPQRSPWIGQQSRQIVRDVQGLPGIRESRTDETPWCAASSARCLRLIGLCQQRSVGRAVSDIRRRSQADPKRGCIVVFWRGAHLRNSWSRRPFSITRGRTMLPVLGGNQGRCRHDSKIPKSRVLAYRWPTVTAPLPTNTTLPIF